MKVNYYLINLLEIKTSPIKNIKQSHNENSERKLEYNKGNIICFYFNI